MAQKDPVNELLAGFVWGSLALAGNVVGLYLSLATRGAGSSLVLAALIDIALVLVLLKYGKKTAAIAVGCASAVSIGLIALLLMSLPRR